MTDFHDDSGITTADPETDASPGSDDTPSPSPEPGPDQPLAEPAPAATPDPAPVESVAETRFKSCRWHETQEGDLPDYCSNRDVIPFAGKNGFRPEAWCAECDFYKVKRTVKKRRDDDWDDY